MKPEDMKSRSLAGYADSLQASGRYTFLRKEAMAALGVSAPGLKKAVMRLVAKGRLVVPRRGYYVIVPVEYRNSGAPPPSWFIDDYMRRIERPYYVGVLSAAAIHGAAHQKPQAFQVVTDAALRPMRFGRAQVRFLGKRLIDSALTMSINTETGTMQVSTPETTALDLVRYIHAAGGLGNAATVLTELADEIDPDRLAESARRTGERSHAQRLGYLLDRVGGRRKASVLHKWLSPLQPKRIPLRPGKPTRGCSTDSRWRVIINELVEADL